MKNIHINIPSKQLLPNVIPILNLVKIKDEEGDPHEIEEIILIYGDKHPAQEVQILETFYRKKDFNTRPIFCGSTTDYDLILASLTPLVEALQRDYSNDRIILNITGGTKLMSLALFIAFRALKNVSIIYTDTKMKSIQHLSGDDLKIPFQSVLNIADYFELNKCHIVSLVDSTLEIEQTVLARKEITKQLIKIAVEKAYNKNPISFLNYLASRVTKDSPDLNDGSLSTGVSYLSKPDKMLLELLEKGKLLKLENNNQLFFKNKDTHNYCKGGWLEEYTYCCAIEAEVDHVALNVKVKTTPKHKDAEDVAQEMDCVIVHNNQMLLIECKTGSLKGGEAGSISLKLDSVTTNLGGVFATGWLVSIDKPDPKVIERLKINGNNAYSGDELLELTKHIKAWKKRASTK